MKQRTSGIRHDYKDVVIRPPKPGRWFLFFVGLSLPLAVVALLLLSEPRAPLRPAPSPVEQVVAVSASTAAAVGEPVADAAEATLSALEPSTTTLDLLVKRGDTLEILFRRNGLSLTDLATMIALPDVGAALKILKPGDRLEVAHRDGEVVSLRRELDEIKLLFIARSDPGFVASTIEREVDIRAVGAHGTIDTSLFEAGTAAGLSDRTTMAMAGIFDWDIDFMLDVRQGDSFTIIHEELWRDGVKLRDGEIVAAEFTNQGKSFRAARFDDGDGRTSYFTPEGRSVRKAFMRAPLDARVSSNFNLRRRHPILNTIRAHRGVDYAAPMGSPIRATGDGKVSFRGVQGGYGNTIVLQHGGNITTLYGHLSRFGNARAGARVSQGDIIGYVGQSGLATGPHLHYEYRVNGAHRNPRTVALPPANPVPPELQAEFLAATEPLWRQLDGYAPRTETSIEVGPPVIGPIAATIPGIAD